MRYRIFDWKSRWILDRGKGEEVEVWIEEGMDGELGVGRKMGSDGRE